MKSIQVGNIDEYIAGFPKEVQKKLEEVRAVIRKAAPEAQETIKYAIPTFTFKGNLVHFAAYKNHIGLYPAPRGVAAFKEELAAYEGGKGTVQFPFENRLPLGLIGRIVKFRVKQALEKEQIKAKKK